MRPVAIVRHFHTEGPGYFAIHLARSSVPWQLVRIDAGDPVPQDPTRFSGVVFMGGPMSVNDPLPWIEPACALVRRCVDAGVPVLGHCLGGQLMAKALGASVIPNREREIGWAEVRVADNAEAAAWFGAEEKTPTVFHWHGETFGLPQGAVRLLSSALCENQAFALGKHLALQCHVEMTAELIEAWSRSGAGEIADHPGPGVQSPEAMQENLDQRLARLHRLADRIYVRWLQGIAG